VLDLTTVNRRGIIALGLAGVFLLACVWALWDRLGAVLLLAVASPLAAAFLFPKDTGLFPRLVLGAAIDGALAALAFLPVLGDLIDAGAAVVALVVLIMRSRQVAVSVPGGIACAALYLFLWFEAGLLPRALSVSGRSPGFWGYCAAIIGSVLAGAVILAVLTALLGLIYRRDRARAVFAMVGFPWFLLTFVLTLFLPNSRVREAGRQAYELRRFGRAGGGDA
jgi:hypothetical protein